MSLVLSLQHDFEEVVRRLCFSSHVHRCRFWCGTVLCRHFSFPHTRNVINLCFRGASFFRSSRCLPCSTHFKSHAIRPALFSDLSLLLACPSSADGLHQPPREENTQDSSHTAAHGKLLTNAKLMLFHLPGSRHCDLWCDVSRSLCARLFLNACQSMTSCRVPASGLVVGHAFSLLQAGNWVDRSSEITSIPPLLTGIRACQGRCFVLRFESACCVLPTLCCVAVSVYCLLIPRDVQSMKKSDGLKCFEA